MSSPEYLGYHDDEWGRPVRDDVGVFERLCLEGFQSGLSWLTILRKRENFRAAFDGFRIETVAGYGAADVARLLADRGIVRNRAKIEAVIGNARAALELPAGLAALVWGIRRQARDGKAPAQTLDDLRRGHRGIKGAGRRAQAGRIRLRRPGDGLLDHAGLRCRRRPPGRLLPPRRLGLAPGRGPPPQAAG